MQKLRTKLDISALYDLSLSIGQSLDFQDNCQNFTTAFKKCLKQDACSVWLKESANDGVFKQVFKNEKAILKIKTIAEDADLLGFWEAANFSSFSSDDIFFIENADLFYNKKGVISLLKLSEDIFMITQNVKSETTLSQEVYDQIKPLLRQFSTSLEACLKNDQLLEVKKTNDSLTKYKMIVESFPDGIYTTDLDHNITFLNQEIENLSGYKKEHILGVNSRDLHVHEETIVRIEAAIARSGKGTMEITEIQHVNQKTGKPYWARIHLAPLKDQTGKIIGIVGAFRDYTVQKQIELDLIESEWMFRNFFEESPLGIIMGDPAVEANINKRFCEMLGYERQELNNDKIISKITHPDDKSAHVEGLQQLYEGRVETASYQKRYIKKDGNILWVNVTLSILKDEIKGVNNVFAMIEDIHEEKILHDSLKFINQLDTQDSDALFKETAKKIAETFELLHVLVAEIDEKSNSYESLGFWDNGKFSPFEYPYINSPCQDAVNSKTFFSTNQNVQGCYPHSFGLKLLKAESYIANPIISTNGEVIGLIALFHTKKVDNLELVERVLRLYSNRLATELERIKYSQSLLRSSKKLNKAEKIAKIGSWELNLKTKELYTSEGIGHIFGKTRNGTIPNMEELRALVHPDDRSRLEHITVNFIRKGKPWEFELRYLINGKTIYAYNKGKSSVENGEVVRLFGTIQDITDKKEVEASLMIVTSKYNDLLKNINDSVIVLDKEQNILDCNLSAQRILEYSKVELTKINVRDFIHPEDLEEAETFVEKNRKDGFFRDMQTRVVTKSGEIKYITVDSDLIYENGVVVGSRDIFRDITELKLIEQKRELLYKKVEQANKELKDFAYIVSHDLKAPLRAIGSLSQWLAEDYTDQIDKKGQEHLALLNNRVHRMHNFIDGILEYSRLGRIKVVKEPVNINKLVKSVVESLDSKNVEIKIQPGLPTIKCEKFRMYQVFQNLISNAIKYNDKEKGLVNVEYKELPKAHQFSITDNGIGIDEKYRDKIFQIFQTLQARDRFESTGIGLTIVKRVIELHGGTIRVKSNLGKKTTFEFTISKS